MIKIKRLEKISSLFCLLFEEVAIQYKYLKHIEIEK